MPHDVFISYSSNDKPIADGVCATLEQNGLRCWIAPRDVSPGAEWSASIIQALAESRVFVLVLSHSANASNQIKREVERAVHNGLPIIPYRIEDVMPTETLEYFISTPHWLDAFTPPVEQHAQLLAAAIRRLLGADAPRSPAPLAPTPLSAKPAGAPMQVIIGAAALGVFVLAAIGFAAFRPKPLEPIAAQAGQSPSFVGDWTAQKVTWAPGVSAGYGPVTLGELWAAQMNANRTGGTFSLDASGGFQTVVEVDDTGTVSAVGQQFVFTSTDAATAMVRARLAPGATLGGQLNETGLVLQGAGRAPEGWVGVLDQTAAGGPLANLAGAWRSANWPALPNGQVSTATLTVTPAGGYTLKLSQKSGGTFTASGGAWSVSVAGAGGAVGQGGGAYAFNGPNEVTVSSPLNSTTWARR